MARGEIVWRAEDSEAELGYRYRAEAHADLRFRWHALWLLRRGMRRADVCEVIGCAARALRTWIGWYREGGCAAIAHHRRGNRHPKACRLSVEGQAELAAEAAAGALPRVADAQRWAATAHGVTYSYWGMRSLLDRLRIHRRVPRPLAVQGDLAAQEAWKKGGSRKRCAPGG